MRPTQALHDLGQSLWLDNITRSMLNNGKIKEFIDHYSVTGLTSNPSIFHNAIETGEYDDAIKALDERGLSREEIFFTLAIEDLRRAADLFSTINHDTNGVDGWVSLEVSPLLAHDSAATKDAAKSLYDRAARANLFIKIPGTPEGLPAIEESIFAGIPINVTLLFDATQYAAAANAYLSGIERRIAAGLDPDVRSVASVFISRWDTAVASTVPADLKNQLGLAIGLEVYRAYRDVLQSDRCAAIVEAGGKPQRLLWASTKTKDPAASDTLYIQGLASPNTVNTMPDSTLEAFFDHGVVGAALPENGGDYASRLRAFADAGVDQHALALQLQNEGAASFTASWNELLERVDSQLTKMASS